MERNIHSRYDDDLTLGSEEYDDSYYTGAEDLFEISMGEESPLSQLKHLVLSIDWEITDDVLLMFNDELVRLKDYWAESQINLIYVQALEKISKYIYIKKANSHPSAIKLLLTLYQNLEKIVSDESLTEDEQKSILFEDVKRFDLLKAHIKREAMGGDADQLASGGGSLDDLLTLKAMVLGIDWEITDEDLNSLRLEVNALEKKFAASKPRLLLLQGIGNLGAYIKHKKSNAHAEAFKMLHLFYESLEKIVVGTLSYEEEKAVLLPAIDKFNDFKKMLGSSISPETISRELAEKEESIDGGEVMPAFSDFSEDEVHGFQAEEEAEALGYSSSDDVVSHVSDFFAADPAASSGEEESTQALPQEGLDAKTALLGVAVESEADDDRDEAPLPSLGIEPAPAFSGLSLEEEASEFSEASSDNHQEDELVAKVDGFFADKDEPESPVADSEPAPALTDVEDGTAGDPLDGVAVESEADDEGDEAPLPSLGIEPAPAFSGLSLEEEASEFSEFRSDNHQEDELVAKVDGFFTDKDEPESPVADSEPAPAFTDVEDGTAGDPLDGVAVESEADDEGDEAPLPSLGTEPAPAFSGLSLEEEASEFSEASSENQQEDELVAGVDGFFADKDEPKTPDADPVPAMEPALATAAALAEGASADESDKPPVVFTYVAEDSEITTALRQKAAGWLKDGLSDELPLVEEELARLRQLWWNRPIEETFLDLLSAVVSGCSNHQVSAENGGAEVFFAMVDDLDQALAGAQRLSQLRKATLNLISWQQRLLAGGGKG